MVTIQIKGTLIWFRVSRMVQRGSLRVDQSVSRDKNQVQIDLGFVFQIQSTLRPLLVLKTQ